MWHARCPGKVIQHIFVFLKVLKILGKKYKFQFFRFLGFKIIFWTIRDDRFKGHFILHIWCFFFAFCIKISIFGDFSNICQFSTENSIKLGHLHQYNSKKNSRQFSKILCKDVKLMYREVCQVLRRYL